MTSSTKGFASNLSNPRIRRKSIKSSKMPCPKMRSGPARKPLRFPSTIATARRGPGEAAPEKATTKLSKNIQ
jgi:hypothetical protein